MNSTLYHPKRSWLQNEQTFPHTMVSYTVDMASERVDIPSTRDAPIYPSMVSQTVDMASERIDIPSTDGVPSRPHTIPQRLTMAFQNYPDIPPTVKSRRRSSPYHPM